MNPSYILFLSLNTEVILQSAYVLSTALTGMRAHVTERLVSVRACPTWRGRGVRGAPRGTGTSPAGRGAPTVDVIHPAPLA